MCLYTNIIHFLPPVVLNASKRVYELILWIRKENVSHPSTSPCGVMTLGLLIGINWPLTNQLTDWLGNSLSKTVCSPLFLTCNIVLFKCTIHFQIIGCSWLCNNCILLKLWYPLSISFQLNILQAPWWSWACLWWWQSWFYSSTITTHTVGRCLNG